jgi:hypothetical protein
MGEKQHYKTYVFSQFCFLYVEVLIRSFIIIELLRRRDAIDLS